MPGIPCFLGGPDRIAGQALVLAFHTSLCCSRLQWPPYHGTRPHTRRKPAPEGTGQRLGTTSEGCVTVMVHGTTPGYKPGADSYAVRARGCSASTCPTPLVALGPTDSRREASGTVAETLNSVEGATGADATTALVAPCSVDSAGEASGPAVETAESRHVCSVSCGTVAHDVTSCGLPAFLPLSGPVDGVERILPTPSHYHRSGLHGRSTEGSSTEARLNLRRVPVQQSAAFLARQGRSSFPPVRPRSQRVAGPD